MSGTTGLTRGAYTGKETKLYYSTAYDPLAWVEIVRARNVQTNRGPALTDIEFHGAAETGAVPGYKKFAGSFEYVRTKATDTVYAFLLAAQEAGDPVHLGHLNGAIDVTGPTGWQCPVLLGEFSEVANGNDGVVVTIPFSKADVVDGSGDAVNYAALAGAAP